MDKDNLIICITIMTIVVCFAMASIINHNKEAEIEKYRIQMQAYGEDINLSEDK